MAKKKIIPLTEAEHADLAAKCDNEGGLIGGYVDYGPDMEAIERLGFDLEKVQFAIDLLSEVESKIFEATDLDDEESEEELDEDEE